jgi:hypothetical protein
MRNEHELARYREDIARNAEDLVFVRSKRIVGVVVLFVRVAFHRSPLQATNAIVLLPEPIHWASITESLA